MENLKKLFDLKSKTAVVTGGHRHLGLAVTEALIELGAFVCIASRKESKADSSLINNINSDNNICNEYKFYDIDVSSSESVNSCIKNILVDHKKIDILINNACFVTLSNLEHMSDEDWQKGLDGTINGVYKVTRAVLPVMKERQYGSIINIASMYGVVSPDPSIYGDTGMNSPANYGAGKAAIIQFTKYLSVHFADYGIRANSISPGSFPTEEAQKKEWFIKNLSNKNPMKRIGKPHELKGVIALLASEASSYITGQNICVDGGWTTW